MIYLYNDISVEYLYVDEISVNNPADDLSVDYILVYVDDISADDLSKG